MRSFLLRWILLGLALWAAGRLVPEHLISVSSVWSAFLAVAVIGLLNALVKPVLFLLKIVTFPINWLTLGLFALLVSFIMNVIIFWAVGHFMPGFQVRGALAAALGAGIMAVVNGAAVILVSGPRRRQGRW